MNDIYEQKAKKYKYKYLELKKRIEYIGEGGGGGVFKRLFGWNKNPKSKTIETEQARKDTEAHEARLNNDPLYKKCFNIYSNSVLNSNSNREDTSYDILFKRREDEIHKNEVAAFNGSYDPIKINKYNFWEFYAAKCPTLAQIAVEDKIKADKEEIKKAEQKLENEEKLKKQNETNDFKNRVEKCMIKKIKECEEEEKNKIEQEKNPYVAPEKVPQWVEIEEMNQKAADQKNKEREEREEREKWKKEMNEQDRLEVQMRIARREQLEAERRRQSASDDIMYQRNQW
jgi:hypothetical protein